MYIHVYILDDVFFLVSDGIAMPFDFFPRNIYRLSLLDKVKGPK